MAKRQKKSERHEDVAAWKRQLEEVLRQVPGYDPWCQVEDAGGGSGGEAWLDHEAALRAINWFAEHLKHVEGTSKGEPFVLRAWQAAIVGNLYGWKRRDEKGRVVRRYRKALIYVPRGNGKTPLSAGIILLGYYTDHEPGAQCYLAAGAMNQAGFLFRNAAGMIEQDEELLEAVRIYRGAGQRSIVLKEDPLSFCKVIPAEAAGQHGGIPHMTAIDELHVQESRELVDVFETAMSKMTRAQPMLVMITTADYDRPSICNEVKKYAEMVRDNGGDPEKPGYDPSFFPVIYELGAEEDYSDEKLWVKANPNLDVSVSREQLRAIVRKAKETPGLENEVKRLHFNMKTTTDKSAIRMEDWDACRREYKAEDLVGRVCYGGLDLASREDLASFTLVFPPLPAAEEDCWLVLSYSWCPHRKVGFRSTRGIPYDVWAKKDWLTVTEGDRIDHRVIREDIVELGKQFAIKEIYYDPRDATEIVQNLQDVDGFAMVEVTQTLSNLSAPTKELLSRVSAKKLGHDGNPVLRWAVSNLSLHFRGKIPEGDTVIEHLDKVPVMPSKQSSKDKIDPVVAAVMGILGVISHPSESGSDDVVATAF